MMFGIMISGMTFSAVFGEFTTLEIKRPAATPTMAVENIQTAYQIGRGFLEKVEEIAGEDPVDAPSDEGGAEARDDDGGEVEHGPAEPVASD